MWRKNLFLLCVVSVLSMSGLVQADLIGHWKLDEGSGTTAIDSSGDGYNCTFHGNPTWTEGVFGDALELDGSSDYLTVDAGADVVTPESFTVAMWVFFNDTAGRRDFFFKDDSPTFSLNEWASDGRIHPVIRTGDSSWGQFPGNTTVETGRWYHVAMSYDNDSHIFALYLDGVNDGEQNFPSGVYYPAGGTWYIGGRPGYVLDGKIDDVRMYDTVLSAGEIQVIMKGELPVKAAKPQPGDETDDVSRDTILNWKPGVFAETHNVFFGTDFNDVNDASTSNHLSATVTEGLDANSFDPGRLNFSTTYYWRIDEVNAPSNPGTYKGNVWSFTVEPLAYKVPSQSITASASSSYTGYDPNDTINESGLSPDNMDLHSSVQTDMWISGAGANSVWIRYDFNKIYELHQMMVWNFNVPMILNAGFKDVTIEYSTDGQNWTELPDVPEFAIGTGTNTYMYNTIVDFNDVAAKSVRLTAKSNWGMQLYGLSEVRFTYIPVWARNPEPEDEAVDVPIGAVLTWRAGREAGEHNVYISTDEHAVMNGNATTFTVEENKYSPDLQIGLIYYWRVDEVNEAKTPSVWEGDIWSFTTQEYITVDDFEDYNDTQPYTVWDTWIDGITNSAYGGSQMGNEYEPFCEQTIVHGGNQSAPLNYDNTSETKSEVVADTSNLAIGSDWSAGNANTLVIWFRGDPNNPVTDQIYVKLNNAKIVYDTNFADIAGTTWKEWQIDIPSMPGVDLGNISSITIGVERMGATGSKGTIYLDDIQLTVVQPAEPIPVENFSFELPGTEKIKGWDGEGIDGTPAVDVPGWSSDSAPEDSGVETGQGATDGIWSGFMKGSDPSVWQLTDHVIEEGDVIKLVLDARNTWQATTLQMSLYYDDEGTRVPVSVRDAQLSGEMKRFALIFNAASAPDSIGKRLGIEIDNTTANGESWIGFDNIQLGLLDQ